MASPFKMTGTNPSRDSSFLRAGRYLVRLESLKFNTTRKGRQNAVLKMLIVAVLDPSAAATVPQGPHRIGDRADWMLMADNDMSAPNLKAALMAITEVPDTEITDEVLEQMAGPLQPLQGLFAEVDAALRIAKSGNPFTLVSFKRRIRAAEVAKLAAPEVLKSLRIDLSKEE